MVILSSGNPNAGHWGLKIPTHISYVCTVHFYILTSSVWHVDNHYIVASPWLALLGLASVCFFGKEREATSTKQKGRADANVWPGKIMQVQSPYKCSNVQWSPSHPWNHKPLSSLLKP